jgi:hypothetical protein
MTQARNLSRLLNKVMATYTYTATNGQTTFSGADNNSLTLEYVPQNLIVTYNGVVLENGTEYTATNGTSIVLSSGAELDAEVNVNAFQSITVGGYLSTTLGGTVGGPVTVNGAFTSLGIDDNATSTAMTLDSSGHVLVGKTTQTVDTVGGEILSTGIGQFTVNGNFAGRFTRQTSDGDIVVFRKGTGTVGSIGTSSGYMVIGSPVGSDAHLLIGNNLVHPATSTGSAKDASIDIGGSSNRFKDLYLSGGVVFNVAGGTGTSTSGTLDDYEEGTWTAELYDASTGGNASSSTNTGNYTKVGRLVTASCSFGNFSTAGMTGANVLYFTLPFPNYSGTVMGSARIVANLDVSTRSIASQVNTALSRGSIVQSRDAQSLLNVNVVDCTSGVADLSITVTYHAE